MNTSLYLVSCFVLFCFVLFFHFLIVTFDHVSEPIQFALFERNHEYVGFENNGFKTHGPIVFELSA